MQNKIIEEEQKREENPQIPYLIKIPKVESKFTESTLIGVLDSSYSMDSYWPKLSQMWNKYTAQCQDKKLVTFSSSSHIYDNCQTISQRIEDYNPGGTSIHTGFEKTNQIIKLEQTQENITILFVSDGQDGEPGKLDQRLQDIKLNIKGDVKINFISIGVGSGFPTKIAMRLRDMYHTGETNIPPLFLIDQPNSLECWEQQFSLIEPLLFHKEEIVLQTKVQNFPWSVPVNTVYANSWVLSDQPQIVDMDNTMELKFNENFEIPSIVEVLKQWLGELQLLSLKQNTKEQANQCIVMIDYWKSKIMESQRQKNGNKKLTFHEKMVKKQSVDIFRDFNILAKEIKSYSEENILNKLSEQEAAKRLAIGTQLGKYHSKAMNIRGFTTEDFEKAKSKFFDMMDDIKISPESDQEPSLVSLQNQKDILLEADFLEGIKICPSQYDLVENLPLVGHAIQIKRTDGSMINPYLITVTGMARHHRVVDTVSIQQSEGNQLVLKTGDGDTEIVNAVIPLIGYKDKDLRYVYLSKMFQILMTFNVMQNADTCFDTAYIALQANTLVYLMQQTASQWRKDMLDQLYQTFDITFGQYSGFETYKNQLLENPRIAMITEHPDIKTRCEDLSKPMLSLFYMIEQKVVTEQQEIVKILKSIMSELFGRYYPNETQVISFFQLKNKEELQKLDFSIYVDQLLKEFPDVMSFYTLDEIKNELTQRILKLDIKFEGVDFSVRLDMESIKFLNYGKFCIDTMKLIVKYFLNDDQEAIQEFFSEENIIEWLYHASVYRNSKERNTSEIISHEEIMKLIVQKKQTEILQDNTIFQDTIQVLQESYAKQMNEIHDYVMPMDKDMLKAKIMEMDSSYQEKIDAYSFNCVSDLLKNACMAPQCPYYLKHDNRLSGHRYVLNEVAAFHKTIKIMKNEKDVEIILNAILEEKCIDQNGPLATVDDSDKKRIRDNWDHYKVLVEDIRQIYLKIN